MVFLHLRVLFFCCSPGSFQKENSAGEHLLKQRVSGVSFVVIWERSGALGVLLWGCEVGTIHCFFLVRWDTWSAFCHFLLPETSSRFRLRRMKERKEGEGEAGDMKDRIISRKRSMGMSQLWIYDVYEFRNMWGFTVFGYIVLIKTYQQLGFLWKRWKLNTCTGFRLVVLLTWDVLTKEIGAPPQKMCKNGSDVATGKIENWNLQRFLSQGFDINGLWKLDVNQKWFPGWKGNSGWEDGHFCYLYKCQISGEGSTLLPAIMVQWNMAPLKTRLNSSSRD